MSRPSRVWTLFGDVAWRSGLLMAAAALLVALSFATGLSERAARHTDHGGDVHGGASHGATVRSEADFLVAMITHHTEAIESAEAIAVITERDEVRELAQRIVSQQGEEVEAMHAWLEDTDDRHAPDSDRSLAAGHDASEGPSEPMMRPFVGLRPAEADQVFVADMILHHEAAAAMAASYLELRGAQQPEVVAFAQELVRVQAAEREVLELMLRMWGAAPMDHGSH